MMVGIMKEDKLVLEIGSKCGMGVGLFLRRRLGKFSWGDIDVFRIVGEGWIMKDSNVSFMGWEIFWGNREL